MDWIIPAITAAAGLGGAWIMGRFTLRAQELAQREENVRNSKKLAYDSSFQEWKFLCELEIDSARAEGRKSILPPPLTHDRTSGESAGGLAGGRLSP